MPAHGAARGSCASRTWTPPAACPAPTGSSWTSSRPAASCPTNRRCGSPRVVRCTGRPWTASPPPASPTRAAARAATSPARSRPRVSRSRATVNSSTPAPAAPACTASRRGPCGCARTGRRSTGPTAALARRNSMWPRPWATSCCTAPTACGPTSWPWWWTTTCRASPTSCAARTWRTTRPGRSCCSTRWGTRPPATCTRRSCAMRRARSCRSRPAPWRST